MSRELVGQNEALDINAQVDRILRDLGDPGPPLSLRMVRELLDLDRQYYSKHDTSFLQDFSHRMKVGAKQFVARPALLIEVLTKANLSAFYLPDVKRILIDEDVPEKKHRWIEAHEILHGVIEWHSDFCFGDNQFTLNPQCDATIEAEANYGGGRLIFLGNRFTEEVRASDLNFKNIKRHAAEYSNSIQSTLWRSVEEQAPDQAVFGMVSIHPRHPEIGAKDYAKEPRFIRSKRFQQQFSNISPEEAYALLEKHARWSKVGPIVDAEDTLIDVDGNTFEFRIEAFSTKHALLTFGVCCRAKTVMVPAGS